jgi:GNAT superfamily N-acetyltransferase
MCVTAHLRGRGVGSKLVDAFKNWAQAQGAERMIVEAFDGNEDALRFYEKQGFSGYSVTLSRVMNEMEGPMRCSEEWKKGTSI